MKGDLIPEREDYMDRPLEREHLTAEPFSLFASWLEQAVATGVGEANAFCLCTVDLAGYPDGRMVLLKEVEGESLVFYTNYESGKAEQLRRAPRAAAVFWWRQLERQVRFMGDVEPVEPELSDSYFATRPRDSQLGAWASRQSQPIPDRAFFEARLAEAAKTFPDNVPRPPYWGGYRLTPHRVEFWQGRANRLHDRFRYGREGARWTVERLMP